MCTRGFIFCAESINLSEEAGVSLNVTDSNARLPDFIITNRAKES